MIRFEIWHKDTKQSELILDKKLIKIGRDFDNDVCLDDLSVSRHHAEIEQIDDKYLIRDLGSKNGTYVNQQRLLEGTINDKDEISLGEIKLVFNIIDSDKPSGLEDYLLHLEDKFVHQEVVEKEITRYQIRKELADTEEKPTDIKYLRLKARLQAHIEIGELLLRSELTLTDLLARIINLIHQHINFDYGAILLYDKKQEKLLPRAIYINPEENTQSLSISNSICNTCFSARTAIISSDAFRDPRFEDSDSISKYQVRSVMAVPMLGRDLPYGVIYVYNKEPQQPFGDDDLNFLIALADEVSLALENFFLREELLRHERLASIGKTIAALSHYIKNILLIAEGASAAIEKAIEDKDFSKIENSWEILKANNERLTDLIQNMLHYAKAKPSILTNDNINVLVRQLTRSIQPKLAKNQIKLTLNLDDSIGNSWLDTHGLYRCLLNLIVNSIEAIEDKPDGEILISTELEQDKNQIVIIVQDNGCGIPADLLPHIYEPFFTTKGRKGTGLGLPITKRIINEMGGTIECESETGVGTTFIIKIPIIKERSEKISESSEFFTPFMK